MEVGEVIHDDEVDGDLDCSVRPRVVMGWSHLDSAIRVVEADDHGIEYLREQVDNLIVPPPPYRTVAEASSVHDALKAEVSLDGMARLRNSVITMIYQKGRDVGDRLRGCELNGRHEVDVGLRLDPGHQDEVGCVQGGVEVRDVGNDFHAC